MTAYADAEVVLSAGAVDSPRLLLLSGVGPAAELEAAGVAVVHDLPGVGRNLHDHPLCGVVYEAAQPIPPGATNHAETSMLWRSDESLAGPDMQLMFIHVPFHPPHLAAPANSFTFGGRHGARGARLDPPRRAGSGDAAADRSELPRCGVRRAADDPRRRGGARDRGHRAVRALARPRGASRTGRHRRGRRCARSSPAAPAPTTTRSAAARWASGRTRWSIPICACTAWTGLRVADASVMPRIVLRQHQRRRRS